MDEPLGVYLQRIRIDRGISLDTISTNTKLKRQLFEDLERGDFSNWPTGRFYVESHLRAYAAAIGVDPRATVDRYREEFDPVPVNEPPPEAPPERPTRTLHVAVPAVFATTFAVSFVVAHLHWREAPHIGEQGAVGMTGITRVTAPSAMELAPALPPASAILRGDIPLAAETLPGRSVPQEPSRPAPKNVEGELTINSTPRANVTVNGVGRGETPVRVRFLPTGSYTIRFVAPGHDIAERKVAISADRPSAHVSVVLQTDDVQGSGR